jgi:hypothetical protein
MIGSGHVKFWLAGLTAWAVLAAGVVAESRVGVSIKSPGQLQSSVGGVTSMFRSHSYGLGSLQAPSGGPSTNILRSSIESRANWTMRSSSGGLPSPTGPIMPAAPKAGLAAYQSAFKPLAYGEGSALPGRTYGTRVPSAMNVAQDYLATIAKTSLPQGGPVPITSMAPGEGGPVGDYMTKGEKAFREGDYETALREFQKANAIDGKRPEVLLSLAHASFAAAGSSYYRTSFYLRKAMKYLPELPLAPLSPKSFFASEAQYTACLVRLEDRIKRFPRDADSHLILAYFRWFDQDVAAARQALEEAHKYGKSPEMIEAVKTFWDGMVASGKVSGELGATTQPVVGGLVTAPANAQASSDAPKGGAESR